MKFDKMRIAGLRWLPVIGCVVLGAIAVSGCTSAVPGDGTAIKPYSELSCEQIQAEYRRLSSSLAAAAGSPKKSGAAEAITLSYPRGAATAGWIDRSMVESDLRHRMEHLADAHREKSCPGQLQAAATASGCALVDEKSVGEQEYSSNCAKCHGATGNGDGWLSGYLRNRTPSLTQLKKNNGGVFPSERVHAVIDGRQEVGVHGPRVMPVWGDTFYATGDAFDSHLACSAEESVRVRIAALIRHISAFQE
jgi:mono/diheme cytochrome c family protein